MGSFLIVLFVTKSSLSNYTIMYVLIVFLLARAQKRLKGEDVYGFKIKVMNSTSSRDSPNRSFQRKYNNILNYVCK